IGWSCMSIVQAPSASATVQSDLKVPKSDLASTAQAPAAGESAASAGAARKAAATAAKTSFFMAESSLGGGGYPFSRSSQLPRVSRFVAQVRLAGPNAAGSSSDSAMR